MSRIEWHCDEAWHCDVMTRVIRYKPPVHHPPPKAKTLVALKPPTCTGDTLGRLNPTKHV